MNSVKVIKIGGKVIDDESKLDSFLQNFADVKGNKILVHGGGAIASKTGEKLGIKPKMIDGRRVTDTKTMDMVTMVYGGLVNKKIVAKLQGLGVKSAGFTGADLDLITAKKRASKPIDFGWAGDIVSVNVDWLLEFLRNNIVTVLAPLTHDKKGHMLNTNADSIASHVASALAEFLNVELIFCFEQDGVMDQKQYLGEINQELFSKLKEEGVISDGMIPKLDLGFEALKKGVQKVSIRNFNAIQKNTAGTELAL